MAIKKRASVTPAAGVAKKQRTALKQCSAVSEAVLGAEGFPEKVLKMVSVELRHCLGVPKENRHAYQEKVIQMAGDVLNSVEAGIMKNIESCETKLRSASTEKTARDQAQEAADLAVTTKACALEATQAELELSVVARKAAKTAASQAVAAQAEGDVELEEACGKGAKLESALHESFTPLKEGSVAGPVAQGCISALSKLGKEFGFDGSMLTSLPSALAKSPSERGTFDAMVWQQLEDELNKQIKTLQETLANGEPAKAERAAAVDAAHAASESAKAHEESCKNNLEQSETELKEAKEARKAATKAVSQFGPEMKQVDKDLKSAKADLVAFTEGASAAYKEMVDFTAVLPPTIAQDADASAVA